MRRTRTHPRTSTRGLWPGPTRWRRTASASRPKAKRTSSATVRRMARGGYVMQLGSVPYREAWDLQRSLAGAVSQGAVPDTILLLEHPPVVTLGRRTDEGELHIPADADV